jgi:hypothetical protein
VNGYELTPIAETNEELHLVAEDLEAAFKNEEEEERTLCRNTSHEEEWHWGETLQAWHKPEERALFLTLFWPRFLFGAYGCFVLLCIEYTLEYRGSGLSVALGPLASDTSGFVWSHNLSSWLEGHRPEWFSLVSGTQYSPARKRALSHLASVLGVACGNLVIVCVFAFFELILG